MAVYAPLAAALGLTNNGQNTGSTSSSKKARSKTNTSEEEQKTSKANALIFGSLNTNGNSGNALNVKPTQNQQQQSPNNANTSTTAPTTDDVTRGRGGNNRARQEWVYQNGTRTATQQTGAANNGQTPSGNVGLSDDEKAQLQSAYIDAVGKYGEASEKAKSIRPEEGLDYAATLEAYRTAKQAANEEKAAAESEANRLRQQLEANDIEVPIEPSDYDQNAFERLWGAIKGGTKQAVGSLGGLAGYTGRLATSGQSAVDKALSSIGDENLSALYHVSTEEENQKAMQMQQGIADKAADISNSGSGDIERSKAGASGVGGLLLDAVSQVPSLAAEMAANVVLPGSGMALMAARSFGGGVQQAEADGASLAGAGAYGTASALKEYLTEKMFGGLDLAYGKGFTDDLVEKAIGRMAKTDAGRTALRVGTNFGGEFLEEIVSDAVDPTLRSLYNDKSVAENYSEEELLDWLYDGLVGGILGAAGTGVSIATGDNARKNAALRGSDNGNATTVDTTPTDTTPTDAAQVNTAPSAEAQNAVADILSRGRVNQEQAAQIMNSPEFVQAFEALTGQQLSGTTNEMRTEIQTAARDYAYQQKVQQQEAAAAEQAKVDTQTEAEKALAEHSQQEAERDAEWAERRQELEHYDSYDSYVRGLIRNGMTPAEAGEIVRNPQLRATWEQLTGKKLPTESVNKARQMILNTHADALQSQPQNTANGIDNVIELLTGEKATTEAQNSVEAQGDITTPPNVSNDATASPVELNSAPNGEANVQNANIPQNTAQSGTGNAPVNPTPIVDNTAAVNNTPSTNSNSTPQNVNSEQSRNSGTEQKVKSNFGTQSPDARTSQTVETLLDSDIISDERAEQLNPYVEKGRFDYIPDTNEAQVDRATEKIAKVGWEQSVKDFHDEVVKGKSGKDLMAEGAVLLNNAANSDASAKAYLDLANDYIELAHRAGEALQAAKIVQQLTPEGRLYLLSKNVDSINKNLTESQRNKIAKKKGSKDKALSPDDIASGYDVTIDETLAQEYLNAETEEARDAALSKIQQNIADQIPATALEKWNALRYVNMLGNFKTQIRNVGGNVLMMVTQKAKNRVKAAAEATANLFLTGENKLERTSVFHVDRNLKKEAAADFETVKDIARGEGKYSDTAKMSRDIQDKRRMFDSKVIEFYRKATNWAMDAGDVIFLKENYADALGGWLQAHGIKSMADATDEQLDRARAYAIQEAQEATFRDTNVVSKAVSQIGRNPITEGVIPFRKTPANVAVRAVEYSPFGAAETVYKAVQAKKGNATANDVVNSLSKNIVGTTLATAGYALAKAGFARSSEDDDDLETFQKMEGQQDYGVKIGDTWISLSQLAPDAVPLYMGVMLYEAMDGGGLTWDNAYSLLGCLNDPLMDMSMLSGVEDTLSDVISYGDDGNMLWKTVTNAALSYLTQGLNNTLVGQMEQASEENRQTVYSDDESVLPDNVQYKLGKALGKIPGVDYHQQDYVDAWGRKQTNGSLGERLFDAFLNPFYSSKDTTTEVDAELERLYKAGKDVDGFPNVLPQKASRSMEYTAGTDMTAEEYEQYSIERGQKSYELVSDFMASNEYKNMTDQQRAEVISDLYSYAADRALKTVKTANGVEYTGKLDNVSEMSDIPEYYASKEILSDTVGESANYDAIDTLLRNFSNLSSDTQTALKDSSDLNVNDLLYAQLFGIDSKSYYDTSAKVKEASETLGGTGNATAIAVYNSMDGASDEEILNAIRTQLTPDAGGKQNAVVRRAEAYMTVAGSNADLGSWLNLVAELADADENSSVSKADVEAAWSNMGLSSKQTYAGITQTDFYNIVKSSKSYASNSDYATQIDENYAKIDPATEKEKAQLGGTVNGHSKSDTSSSSSDSSYDATMEYFRALGLIG